MSDTGNRIRAAREYAGMTQTDLAKRLRRGRGWVLARENGQHQVSDGDKYEIAKACGLPIAWFTVDFSRLPEISGQRGDGRTGHPPGVLGHDATGSETTPPRPQQPQPPEEQDRKAGSGG